MIVPKISVARDEAPVYMMDGVVSPPHESSDVQAQPDDLTRLMVKFAY
jgi:hypothetical protein